MQEERLMILKLLEEGKINVDEASRLLDTLNLNMGYKKLNHSNQNMGELLEDKVNKLAQSVNSLAKDLAQYASKTYKKVEPSLKKMTKSALNKTSEITQSLSNKINPEENNNNNQDQK
jgi:hypothetical protein